MTSLIEVPKLVISIARKGKWGGDQKMEWNVKEDGKNFDLCADNRFIGNIGELLVHAYIKHTHKLDVAIPNQMICGEFAKWEDDVRSFEPLYVNSPDGCISVGNHIHVKTQKQSSATRFGRSWMWQLERNHGRGMDPILLGPSNDLVALVELHEPNDTSINTGWKAKIHFVIWKDAFPHVSLPKKESLRKKKRVVYYNDIKDVTFGVESISNKQMELSL